MMHPWLRVEPVDTAPLASLIQRIPGLRLVLLNALGKLRGQPLLDLLAAGEVFVEISMLEGVGGIANLLALLGNDADVAPEAARDSIGRAQAPADRVLFGSYAPLFYFESSLLKLKESPLTQEQLRAIRNGNARRLTSW